MHINLVNKLNYRAVNFYPYAVHYVPMHAKKIKTVLQTN